MNNENNNVVPTPQENSGINTSPMPNVDNSQTVQPVPNVFTNQPAQPVNDIPVQPVNNVEPVQPANEVVSQPTVSESIEQINIGESVNPVPPVQESQVNNVQPTVEQQPIGSQQVLNSEEVKVVDSKPEEPKNDTISQTVQSFYNEPKKKKSKAVPFLVFIIILLCLGIVAMYLYYNGYLDKYIGGSTTNNSVEQKDSSTNNDKEGTTTSNESEGNTSKLSDEEALKLGNEMFESANKVFYGNDCSNINKTLTYFTEDFKYSLTMDKEPNETDISDYIKSVCTTGGLTGNATHLSTKLTLETVKSDEIVYLVTSEFCGDSSWAGPGNECSHYSIIVKSRHFVIIKVNNEWKIKKYNVPR